MARKGKGFTGRKRSVSDAEAEVRFNRSLALIGALCDQMDAGQHDMALPVAVEIMNLLTSGGYATRRRGEVRFPSPVADDHPDIMSAFYRLTAITITSPPPMGHFRARALIGSEPNTWASLKFSVWWNEVVFRASNAKPGLPLGVVALLEEEQVPFAEREYLTRRLLVQSLRDHAAAHHLSEWPVVFDEIDGPTSWGGFAFQDEGTGQTFSTDDGTLGWGLGQLGASIREIAEEVMIALGVRALAFQSPDAESAGFINASIKMTTNPEIGA